MLNNLNLKGAWEWLKSLQGSKKSSSNHEENNKTYNATYAKRDEYHINKLDVHIHTRL